MGTSVSINHHMISFKKKKEKIELPGAFHLSHKVISDFKLKNLGHPAFSPLKRGSMARIPLDPSIPLRKTHDKNRLTTSEVL